MLFLCAFLGAAVWMSRVTISSVSPAIKVEFNLKYAQLGLPPTTALAFAAVGYGVSGFLTHRYGARRVLLISVFVMLVGAIGTSISTNLVSLAAFQGLAGLSEGLFYVDALVILTSTFQPATIGRSFGILESAINVGILISFLSGAAITSTFGWRAAYQLLTLLAVASLILIVFSFKEPVRDHQQTDLRALLRDRYVATLFIPITMMFFAFWSFWAFVPTYLTDVLHTPLTVSGAISSAAFLLAIFAALAGGLLADRQGPKRASIAITAFYMVSLVIFAGTNDLSVSVLSLLIVTFAQASLVPVILSFVPKRFPQAELGRAYGIIISVAYAAGAIGPALVGGVADNFGFASAFLILAAIIGLTGLVLIGKL